YGPFGLGETLERGDDRAGQLLAVLGPDRVVGRRDGSISRAPSRLVDEAPVRDGIEPGERGGRVRAEVRERGGRFYKHLLGEVLGAGGVARAPPQVAIHLAVVG